MDIIVTKEVLEIYDKYDQDFGLLHERWASEEDRQKVTPEQCHLLSDYVDKLYLIKLDAPSVEIKAKATKRLAEIEKVMDPEVVQTLRKRVLESDNSS